MSHEMISEVSIPRDPPFKRGDILYREEGGYHHLCKISTIEKYADDIHVFHLTFYRPGF